MSATIYSASETAVYCYQAAAWSIQMQRLIVFLLLNIW